MQNSRKFSWSVLILVTLTACSNLLKPAEWERVVGLIEAGSGAPPPTQLPEVAQQGVPFSANVLTYGSSSCTRPDGAEVRISGRTAEITPYDLERKGEDVVCTADLHPFSRKVTLRFDEAGEATVRVIGQGFNGPARFEIRITVQP